MRPLHEGERASFSNNDSANGEPFRTIEGSHDNFCTTGFRRNREIVCAPRLHPESSQCRSWRNRPLSRRPGKNSSSSVRRHPARASAGSCCNKTEDDSSRRNRRSQDPLHRTGPTGRASWFSGTVGGLTQTRPPEVTFSPKRSGRRYRSTQGEILFRDSRNNENPGQTICLSFRNLLTRHQLDDSTYHPNWCRVNRFLRISLRQEVSLHRKEHKSGRE